jgi:hypothetical protein
VTENVKHVEVLRQLRFWSLRGTHDRSALAANIQDRRDEVAALDAAIAALQREAAGDGEVVCFRAHWPDGSLGAWADGKPTAETLATAERCGLRIEYAYSGAPRPTGTDAACTSCDGTGELHRSDGEYVGPCPFHTTPASAEPGCVIRLGVDDWNPYELLDIARLHVPANDLLLDRIKECLRQQRTVQSSTDARGGGEAVRGEATGDTPTFADAWARLTPRDRSIISAYFCEPSRHPTPAALDADAEVERFALSFFGDEAWDRTSNHHNANVIREQIKHALIAARATTGARHE